ncbi:MAG TPA: cation:proton antiporter [Candidatus Limnocylindria bacterium]|nr:cation:proton antiporter [Candidatus Limnocylindria bacterium]
MPDTGLLVNLALALIAAAIGGAIAVRLGQSAILGYIVVGVLIGPYTPGPVGEPGTVAALADIGVIFLLFAIGLQLSLRDLLRVGRVALVGGSVQVIALIAIGAGVGLALGFRPLEALFLGAVISNSSSTVIAKVLGDHGEQDADHGRIAFAWSSVQDLSTIVLVVVLSALSAGGDLGTDLLLAGGRAALFLAILLPVGLKILPWFFEHVALLRSREVFVLSVVALALGTAWAAELFGLSLALGAFVAGILVGESDVSFQALGELAPLRDVFAGLFFVSVGMLVDPMYIIASLPLVLVGVALIVPIKGLISGLIAAAFRLPRRTAVLVGVGLAQSAEFSFLLARLGVDLGVVGADMFGLMMSAAAISIVAAPWLHGATPRALRWLQRRSGEEAMAEPPVISTGRRRGRYIIICGFGRVGRLIGAALEGRGFPYVVIEEDPRVARRLRDRGMTVMQGSAENPRILDRAGIDDAQVLVVAVSDSLALRQLVDHARRVNPRLAIVARARSAADRAFLREKGVQEIVTAETEAALEMARYTLARLGVSAAETGAIVQGLRRRSAGG